MKTISWTAFKSLVVNSELDVHYAEDGDSYYAFNAYFQVCAEIPKNNRNADYEDFTQVYLPWATGKPILNSITEFERSDKLVRLSSATGSFDENGMAVLEISVPGATPSPEGRLIAECYVYEDQFGWGDRMTRVDIDTWGIYSGVSGYVLETFHDPEVPQDQQGWRFYPSHQNSGEMEIEPIGGFGEVPSQTTIRATFQKMSDSPATKLIADIWWGKRN